MKATIDKSVCIGCGVCTSIASSLFSIIDDGLAENIFGNEVPTDLEAAAIDASEACPVSAIVIE